MIYLSIKKVGMLLTQPATRWSYIQTILRFTTKEIVKTRNDPKTLRTLKKKLKRVIIINEIKEAQMGQK